MSLETNFAKKRDKYRNSVEILRIAATGFNNNTNNRQSLDLIPFYKVHNHLIVFENVFLSVTTCLHEN